MERVGGYGEAGLAGLQETVSKGRRLRGTREV